MNLHKMTYEEFKKLQEYDKHRLEYEHNRFFMSNMELIVDTHVGNEDVFRWHVEGLAIRMLIRGVEHSVVSRITGVENIDGLLEYEDNYAPKLEEARKLTKEQRLAHKAVILNISQKIAIKMIKEKLDVDLINEITGLSRDQLAYFQQYVITEK